MKGKERLLAVERSTPTMATALPDLPMPATVMIRLIRISAHVLGSYFEPVFRALDLGEHSFHVLCLLVATEGGRASPSELSELVGTSRANMTRILEELNTANLIAKTVHSRDGRRFDISITAAGRKRVREVVPRMAEPLERAFSDLSPEEFAVLDKLMRKLIVSLDKPARLHRAAA